MLGPRQEFQSALFYEFNLEDHVPDDHLLRSIDRFVDLGDMRSQRKRLNSQVYLVLQFGVWNVRDNFPHVSVSVLEA